MIPVILHWWNHKLLHLFDLFFNCNCWNNTQQGQPRVPQGNGNNYLHRPVIVIDVHHTECVDEERIYSNSHNPPTNERLYHKDIYCKIQVLFYHCLLSMCHPPHCSRRRRHSSTVDDFRMGCKLTHACWITEEQDESWNVQLFPSCFSNADASVWEMHAQQTCLYERYLIDNTMLYLFGIRNHYDKWLQTVNRDEACACDCRRVGDDNRNIIICGRINSLNNCSN